MKANIENIQKTYSEIPGTWEFEGVTYQGYEHFTDLHFAHGWRDVVIHFKLGNGNQILRFLGLCILGIFFVPYCKIKNNLKKI